mmetsp:Transcript_101077/g.184464  ORF Transcript_101077/g.184464 Transcript_101077/m.184464 type:complete len:120 (-) Transcript_101077:656-1015(-)
MSRFTALKISKKGLSFVAAAPVKITYRFSQQLPSHSWQEEDHIMRFPRPFSQSKGSLLMRDAMSESTRMVRTVMVEVMMAVSISYFDATGAIHALGRRCLLMACSAVLALHSLVATMSS